MDRVPLVIDRNDDREGQGLGDPEQTQLAAERLAQGFEKPIPAFGVVGEFGHRGTQRGVVRDRRRLGRRVTNIHRRKILQVSCHPTTGSVGSAVTDFHPTEP